MTINHFFKNYTFITLIIFFPPHLRKWSSRTTTTVKK